MEATMNPKCPYCGRTLINRLTDVCLYCAKQLPPELCLSDDEKRRIKEEELRRLDRERTAQLKKDKEEREERERQQNDVVFLPPVI
jgi:predicted  nucleic acid-binding Zn-ribbon protein